MKKKFITIMFAVLTAWVLTGCGTGSYDQNRNSNYTDNQQGNGEYNYSELDQYGHWVNVDQYGNVWQPAVYRDWQPFTNGYWGYDGADWVWESNEPYGPIVYHYGFWDYDPQYGWIWIPERNQWSPARVQWVTYGDNIAWAPLRKNNRSWPEPWENNNIRPWTMVRMEDFNKQNLNTYNIPPVSRNDGGRNQIQRRPPELQIVRTRAKDPVKIVNVDSRTNRNENQTGRNSTQGRNNIPGNEVTPPVKDVRPTIIPTPPVTKEIPPVTRTPEIKKVKPPVQTDVNPPVKKDAPVIQKTPPPVIRKVPDGKTPDSKSKIKSRTPLKPKIIKTPPKENTSPKTIEKKPDNKKTEREKR